MFALMAVVKLPVARVALVSLVARDAFDATTLPLATACAFWATIFSNTFFA